MNSKRLSAKERTSKALARYRKKVEDKIRQSGYAAPTKQLHASRDDTRLSFDLEPAPEIPDESSASSSSQVEMLQIPTSPLKTTSLRVNIRDVLRHNTITYTGVADDRNEDESSDLDEDAINAIADREEEKANKTRDPDNDDDDDDDDDGDAADNDDDDDDNVMLPNEARVEEIMELFGSELAIELGDTYHDQIVAMYANGEAARLHAILHKVAGDELMKGIDTAARPSYELDDPMDTDVKNDDSDDEDSIEEETRHSLAKAERALRTNVDDVKMQEHFEKTVHDTLDRKQSLISDRESIGMAGIIDITNNALTDGIDDVIAKLTIPDLKARIAKNYSYLRPILTNPELMEQFSRYYRYVTIISALHLRSFVHPETRLTLALAWSLFYGSVDNTVSSGRQNRKKAISIPGPRELGFDPRGDQVTVATTISNEIRGLEDAMQPFTRELNHTIATRPVDEPGIAFFRALQSSDHNVSIRFVSPFQCPVGVTVRCAISGDVLKSGEAVYACRFIGLRTAHQRLIPSTFRGSASWQNQDYRDVFRIFYIKQRITEYPPTTFRNAATPAPAPTPAPAATLLTGSGLICWKADGSHAGYYLRLSALLEKVVSFWRNVYVANPTARIEQISQLTKEPAVFAKLLLSLTPAILSDKAHLHERLNEIAASIGNSNAQFARHVLAVCFCRLEHAREFVVETKPAYLDQFGLTPVAPSAISSIVAVSAANSAIISIFCNSSHDSATYEKMLTAGKGLLGSKLALPGLLVVVKIIDMLLEHSPRA